MSKNDVFFSSINTENALKRASGSVPPGPPGAPPAGPPHQPGGSRGHGEAATTSALVGSSLLAHDAASTYCTG